MSCPFSSRPVLAALGLLALVLAPACTIPPAVPAADPLAALTYDGSQQALESLDRDIAAAGQAPAKLAAISTRLLRLLRTPAATGDARQAAAQRLALFPAATLTAGENPALWLAMFQDERQLNFVKLALDHAPGAAVDEIFLRGFDASTPETRLAFVQSIGNRRIATAVARLAPLLADADVALAAAATKALGQIGTPAALAALRAAPSPASAPVVEARLAAAHHLDTTAGLSEFQAILDTSAAPANLRAAALHGLLFAAPAAAPARIVATLSGDDAAFKPVVLEAIFSLPATDLVSALSAKMVTWDVATQTAVVAALGRRAEAAAVPAVSRATQHADAGLRATAITALGQMPGSPETAALLAGLAIGPDADDAKLARQSLARLDGPGVADTVIPGATADTAKRTVYIEALATRNMTATVPLLRKMRADPNLAVRLAALGSLAELGNASEQAAILDWSIAATDPAEQARALRALAAVSGRIPDLTARARLITDTLDRSSATVALRLLPVLPRLGGVAAAECAARLALRDDPALAAAAALTLVRWTDHTGLLPLVVVAEKSPVNAVRVTAISGATRYLERSRELSSENLRLLITRLLAVAPDAQARGRLAYLLGRCADGESLALAGKLQRDPALAVDAADAALAIRSNQAGRPGLNASASVDQLPAILDGNRRTSWGVHATDSQWIEVDYHSPRPFRQVTIDGGGNQYNYPEHVELFVTSDPKNPGAALGSADGHPGKVVIDLPAGTRGRYLLIRHTKARADAWWSVAELLVD